MSFTTFLLLFICVVLVLTAVIGGTIWRRLSQQERRKGDPARERSEALFKSMFPDLQPYFHPRNLVMFVDSYLLRGAREGSRWHKPAGLGVELAEWVAGGNRERVRLLDQTGNLVAQIDYEPLPKGAVIRFGKGNFTVDLSKRREPRVRYWHPEREFKWRGEGLWQFTNRMADRSFETNEQRTRWSDESLSSSSSSSTSSGSTAGAVFAGAGGAFAGAGASAAWDAPDAHSGGVGETAASSDAAPESSSSTAY